MVNKDNRGGKRPNAGAPKKAHPAKSHTLRFTDTHWLKFNLRGGMEWLRYKLDHPTEKQK